MKRLLLSFALLLGSQPLSAAELAVIASYADGSPAGGVFISINNQIEQVTGDNGIARFELPPGDYAVVMRQGGARIASADTIVQGNDIVEVKVVLRGEREPRVETRRITSSMAASATLAGVVLDAAGDPLQNAFVQAGETTAVSGNDGRFEMVLPRGEYDVVVSHSDLGEQRFGGVFVTPGLEGETRFAYRAASSVRGGDVEEVVATAKYVPDSISIAEQTSSSVLEAISAADISLAGDGNAAAALKRVTGLTITDGSYVYVRGLGERYSSTQFNGSLLASPDSTRRVVPLDLFPAGILRGVTIQKSYSPDMPGEFGGGTVQLVTKTIPDQFFWEVGASVGYREGTTGEDVLTYDGGASDGFGSDDGTRDLPSLVRGAIAVDRDIAPVSSVNPDGFSAAELEAIGEQFPVNYDVKTTSADPNVGLSAGVGNRYALGEDSAWGYIAAFDYGSDWLSRTETRREFTVGAGGDLEVNKNTELQLSRRSIDLSGFLGLGLELAANHTLASTTALLRQSTDDTEIANGYTRINDDIIRETELEWIERELFIQQFTGEHFLEDLGGVEADWRVSYANAVRSQPDTRFYRYDYDSTLDSYVFSTRGDGNQRRWEALDEDTFDYGLDLTYSIVDFEWASEFLLKGGVAYTDKQRDSDVRRFSFFGGNANANNTDLISNPSLENIFNPGNIEPDVFEIRDSTRRTDNYTATQEVTAAYLMADAYLVSPFRVMGGVRLEQSEQRVNTFNVFDPDRLSEVAVVESDDMLPALSVTWFNSEASQLTFAVSQTVSRPDLKELSSAPYTDDQRDVEVRGNPDLEQTEIFNVDLRWQYALDGVDTLSVATFFKDFTNPIEFVTLPGTGDIVTLDNAESATNYGLEFELRRGLTFINEDWYDWFIGFNAAWIESEITLPADALTVNTNATRPLQGQSPWVVNLQFGYDNAMTGRSAVLLFNTAGERIAEVGTFGKPDIHEEPFYQLDFVYKQRLLDELDLSVKLSNILDDEVEYTQGSEVTRSYSNGRVFSVGVTWNGF